MVCTTQCSDDTGPTPLIADKQFRVMDWFGRSKHLYSDNLLVVAEAEPIFKAFPGSFSQKAPMRASSSRRQVHKTLHNSGDLASHHAQPRPTTRRVQTPVDKEEAYRRQHWGS